MFVGIDSLLITMCVDPRDGTQAWQHVPLPTEPSHLLPNSVFNFKADSVIKTAQPHYKHLIPCCLMRFPLILSFMLS